MVGAGTHQFNLVSRLEMLKVADSDFDSLPDDMLMQILIRIPAKDIHDSTMFVCWKWYDMIRSRSFIYTHLHHSTSGLLMVSMKDMALRSLWSPTQGSIQCMMSDFSCYNYNHPYFWTSCNGLMLKLLKNDDMFALTITNPLTKQHLALPRFPARLDQCPHPMDSCAIAYDATRMEYKVVRTCYLRVDTHNPITPMLPKQLTAILTVGVDNSWRRVDTQNLSLATSKQLITRPLVTEGFMHWRDEYSRYVLTMNIQTEVITRIPLPCKGRSYYLQGERYLSLLNRRGFWKWEVWEMKPETGEWTKMPNIDLEDHKALLNELYRKVLDNPSFKPGEGDCLDCKLRPAGWLKYREIIVFFAFLKLHKGISCYPRYQLYVVYNIQTRDIHFFKSTAFFYLSFFVHKNSLVRIPG